MSGMMVGPRTEATAAGAEKLDDSRRARQHPLTPHRGGPILREPEPGAVAHLSAALRVSTPRTHAMSAALGISIRRTHAMRAALGISIRRTHAMSAAVGISIRRTHAMIAALG